MMNGKYRARLNVMHTLVNDMTADAWEDYSMESEPSMREDLGQIYCFLFDIREQLKRELKK